MKWENIKKNEKKILIISSIAILLTFIIGASYAYIAYTTRQKEINVLETDCINVTMEELTNEIRLTNAYPVSDEVGANTKPFRFKLTNTCGVGVDYNLNLEVMGLVDEKSESNPNGKENRIAANNIAVKVDENAKSILNSNPSVTPTYKESDYTAVEAYTVFSGSIKPYENVTHEIRIWLDENADNDSQRGKFYSKVVIEARQNQVAAQNFADYILRDTSKSLEKFEHEETSQTTALTDYRYVGANPDNYVYFGCEGDACTENNLYRIIGVIPTQSEIGKDKPYENRVKLVKASRYIGPNIETDSTKRFVADGKGYSWNKSNTNIWGNSSLNNELNNNYWKSLGAYQQYISQSVWYLGALHSVNFQKYSGEDCYIGERSNVQGYSKGTLNYVNNIGLMYPSDIAYSNGNSYKSLSVNSYSSNVESWLDRHDEWLITPENAESAILAWRVSGNKGAITYNRVTGYIVNIRPTFYLKFNVLYKSGNGTPEEPYRISINE